MKSDQSRILIIDDEYMIRRTVRDYLEDSGYNVAEADEATAGLLMLETDDFGAVLLDLHMPGLSGLEALGIINEKYPNLPVIIISGAGSLDYAIEALRLGAWDYITKPIADMSALEFAIEKALEKARLIEENIRYKKQLEKIVEDRTRMVHFQAKMLDSVREAVIATDLKGTILYWGAGAEKMYGYTAQEALGRHISLSLNEEDMKHRLSRIEETINKGFWFGEILEKTKSGSTLWSETTLSLVEDENGRPMAIVGIDRDISEDVENRKKITQLNKNLEQLVAERTAELSDALQQLKIENEKNSEMARELAETNTELELSRRNILNDSHKLYALNEKLIESQEKLHEANIAKNKFFSIIAHDLKNPLQAILSAADIITTYQHKMTEQDITQKARTIFRSARRLSSLLDDLLQWERAQSGRMRIEAEIFDLREVIENNIELIEAAAARKSISLVSGIAESTYVLADRNMIDTVVRNYLSNAIKFTPELGRVTIEARLAEDSIELCVIDNGVGISPSNLKKIFRPGVQFTTPGTDLESGTGLGLALCKEFIELNRGRVFAESILGVGSRFCFLLPAAKAPDQVESAV
ncbi:MAG: response regulator [Candidatus Kapaibacterium sp.]